MTLNIPRVGAIIVSYKNVPNVLNLVGDLVQQSAPPHEIFVIDNGAGDEARSVMTNKFPDVHYVLMSENTGSSGGFREGTNRACVNNDYVLTLDDDLRLTPDAIEKLLAGFAATHGHTRAAMLTGNEQPFTDGSAHNLHETTDKANKGNLSYSFADLKQRMGFGWRGKLFACEAIKVVGPPRTEYFLYGDDYEYGLRLASAGFKFFAIPDVTFFDNRSSNQSKLSLFMASTTVYRDDFRLYYAFRNQLHIAAEYKQFFSIAKLIGHAIKATIGFILHPVPSSSRNIMAIACGLSDGFRSKLGKNNKFLPENK